MWSSKKQLILDLLGDTERFGLELARASKGKLKRGTIYVILPEMEDERLISSRTEPLGVRLLYRRRQVEEGEEGKEMVN